MTMQLEGGGFVGVLVGLRVGTNVGQRVGGTIFIIWRYSFLGIGLPICTLEFHCPLALTGLPVKFLASAIRFQLAISI